MSIFKTIFYAMPFLALSPALLFENKDTGERFAIEFDKAKLKNLQDMLDLRVDSAYLQKRKDI